MIIALARPVTNEKINESKQELTPIIIAIDVSKSMLANDIYPNRLEFARKKVLDIIQRQKTSAIAVILFAKSSFILSPLTQDFISLKSLIGNLNTGMNFDNGTNIFSTLETTVKLLKNYEYKNLILLSDGSDSDNFEKEIEYAKKNNISIYTIATASKKGAPIKLKDGNYLVDKNGSIVNVKLNDNIKELSLKTNGGYINYSLDNNDIKEILSDINTKAKKEEFQSKKIKTYTELFYYPLVLGILFLLIAYSSLPKIKNKSLLQIFVLLTIFSSFQNTLFASLLDFQTIKNANEAYIQKDFKTASKEFNKLNESSQRNYNLANSLYKEKKYKEAIDLYKNSKTQDNDFKFKNLHNLANSYVKSNDLKNAVKSYEDALKLKENKETRENYNTVKKALEKKEDKNKKDQKKNDKKNKDKDKDQKEKDSNEEKKNKEKSDKQKQKEEEKQNEKNKKMKKNEISDNEEKKWLKHLENKKTNLLLKKVDTNKVSNSETPW
jgi:Ca-activated chloride channel family protein